MKDEEKITITRADLYKTIDYMTEGEGNIFWKLLFAEQLGFKDKGEPIKISKVGDSDSRTK